MSRKNRKLWEWDTMPEEDIRAEIDMEFLHWNTLAREGCADPFWPDGCNMNLTRNHIICWYEILKSRGLAQVNLFGELMERPVPPEVPDNYMVKDGRWHTRLDNKFEYRNKLIWGKERGEYSA